MDVYASEKEQVDALKKWVKENGASVVTGLVLGLAVVFGGKAWFGYQHKISGQASDHYTQMMMALSADNTESVGRKGSTLINEYSSSPYAALAALAMAKVAVAADDFATARNHLEWAMANGKPDAIKETARARLTRLLIVEGDLAGAEGLMAGASPDAAYQAVYDELRGDLWVARGDNRKAGEAYAAAIAGLEPDSSNLLFLQLKLDDTGFAPDPDEAMP